MTFQSSVVLPGLDRGEASKKDHDFVK